ncbi:MAG TPA: type II toxin-antitoxin system HipA family toxin [Xanthobacteraceae bacterium]|nr:type II toxin-antitoxin system HipA family toxin [Xanthobacteraceae bacterium]
MADLPVFFEQRLVGTVDVGADGPGFVYDRKWIETRGAFPISTTMPLGPGRVAAGRFVTWAANLLPESEQLRAVGQFLGMAPGDVIGLLSAIGRDTAGALSFGKPGGTSPVYWRPVDKPDDLERIIEDLPRKPFLVGDEGVSMSLAGVQSKLAVAVDGTGRICIPIGGSPSTHILKPDAERLVGGVHNEAFCLTLARRLGVTTPEVTTGKAGKRTFLLVKRYDRVQAGDRWRRVHQEDFCQALGKPPAAKYESNQTGVRGPSLDDMFDLTRRLMPPTEILRLLDQVIFNVIACNTDAHAKNYSVLIRAGGVSLAPLYDVMCADVWAHVTRNLAQKVGGNGRGEDLNGGDWQRFARGGGLGAQPVLGRVRELAQAAVSAAVPAATEVAAMPGGDHVVLDATRAAVERRAHALLARVEQIAGEPEARTEDGAPRAVPG